MSGKYVGPPVDEPYSAACSYSPTPDDPICGAEGSVHILGESAHHGLVALVACDSHVAAARVSARVLGEHRHAGFCSFPGALWTDEGCVLDGSGPDRAAAAEPAPAVGGVQ